MNNHFKLLSIIIFGLTYFCISCLAGCANPLNQATYYRYTEQGNDAMAAENWGGAERAYQRALTNVEIGNLSPGEKSNALYNLGRVKTILGKHDDSAKYLEQALAIEEKLNSADGHTIGYVLGELAVTYLKQDKMDEGIDLLHRLEVNYLDHSEKKTQRYKMGLKQVFNLYVKELYQRGRELEAKQLESFTSSIIIPDN